MNIKKTQDYCKGCIYWRPASGNYCKTGIHICHYLFDTGHMRNSLPPNCDKKVVQTVKKKRRKSINVRGNRQSKTEEICFS